MPLTPLPTGKSRLPAIATKASATSLLLIFLVCCGKSAREPVTLGCFHQSVGFWQTDPTWEARSQQFTRETGIRLWGFPLPENTLDSLDLSRQLLQRGRSGLDVLFVDPIWVGSLRGDLLDLRPYFAAEIARLKPDLLASYTVDGRVTAVPYQMQIGVLEFRPDLLRKYHYDHPPRTWDELESIASRIQAGERAEGKKNFWGYVWQGAPAEALTCNGLEWQASEGGGRIIENDKTISVNNPGTIRSWRRAKGWIGWISPPSVLAYRELDTINVFDSGGAAFARVWREADVGSGEQESQFRWHESVPTWKVEYAPMPGGAGTIGGLGLAVSRYSVHQQEAIEFVQFLVRAQLHPNKQEAFVPTEQVDAKELESARNPHYAFETWNKEESRMISRPSGVAGKKYEEVTRAYFEAVHAVLSGQKDAGQAASELEKQLIGITGYRSGPPHAPN